MLVGGGIGTAVGVTQNNTTSEEVISDNLGKSPVIDAVGTVTRKPYVFETWVDETLDFSLPTLDVLRAENERLRMYYACYPLPKKYKNLKWKERFKERFTEEDQGGEFECRFKIQDGEKDVTKETVKKVMVDVTKPTISVKHTYMIAETSIEIIVEDGNGSGGSKLEVSKDGSEYYDITSEEAKGGLKQY